MWHKTIRNLFLILFGVIVIGNIFVGSIFGFKLSYYTFVEALLDIKNNNYKSAIEKLEFTVKLDKEATEAYKQLLYLYILTGNSEKVKEVVNILSKLLVDDLEIKFVGKLLYDAGYIEESKFLTVKISGYDIKKDNFSDLSIPQISQLLNLYGSTQKVNLYNKEQDLLEEDGIEKLYKRGLSEYYYGHIPEAVEIFRELVSVKKNDDSFKLTLADLLSMTTMYENHCEAEKIYLDYLSGSATNYDTIARLVVLYLSSNRVKDAEKYIVQLEKLVLDKKYYVYNYYIALFYEYKKDFKNAAKYMNRFIKLCSDSAVSEIAYLKIAYYYLMLKDFNLAEKNLRSCIKNYESSQAKIMLVLVYIETKKFNKAIDVLLDMERSGSRYEKLYFYLGYCFDQIGKFDVAERYFLDSISKYPSDSESMNYLGYTYVDRNINLDKAENLIKRALEIEPENPAYIDSLGWWYFRKGNFVEAEKQIEKAASKLEDVVILEHLLEVKEVVGKKEEAIKIGKKILQINPKNKRVKIKLKMLEKSK